MIPKILHFIWIGDEAKRPDNCIDTWRAHHPGWEIRVWGNRELADKTWLNRAHMTAMYDRELCGVADMMRWEILYAIGGLAFDADSVCLRPLDEALLDCPAFACWENEVSRPGLIANCFVGCEPQNPFIGQIVADIAAAPTVIDRMAWETTGPQRLTDTYRTYAYTPLRIYPSHYFLPEHFTGVRYEGAGPVYARQLWGSTFAAYDTIHDLTLATEPPAEPDPIAPDPIPSEQGEPLYQVRQVAVDDSIATLDQIDVFRSLCAGKRVLFVGSRASAPDPACSVPHLLEPHCARLDWLDVAAAAAPAAPPLEKGRIITDVASITAVYDIVLAPDMMAHVPDIASFLAEIEALGAGCTFLSVPDAFQGRGQHFDYQPENQTFVEVVHPDHKSWYTPGTFSDTIARHSRFQIEKMWFFNGMSLLAMLSNRPLALAA